VTSVQEDHSGCGVYRSECEFLCMLVGGGGPRPCSPTHGHVCVCVCMVYAYVLYVCVSVCRAHTTRAHSHPHLHSDTDRHALTRPSLKTVLHTLTRSLAPSHSNRYARTHARARAARTSTHPAHPHYLAHTRAHLCTPDINVHICIPGGLCNTHTPNTPTLLQSYTVPRARTRTWCTRDMPTHRRTYTHCNQTCCRRSAAMAARTGTRTHAHRHTR
jgi:hypothetical protein